MAYSEIRGGVKYDLPESIERSEIGTDIIMLISDYFSVFFLTFCPNAPFPPEYAPENQERYCSGWWPANIISRRFLAPGKENFASRELNNVGCGSGWSQPGAG